MSGVFYGVIKLAVSDKKYSSWIQLIELTLSKLVFTMP